VAARGEGQKARLVDYAPKESVARWIARETRDDGGAAPASIVKWKVVYEEEDGRVLADLVTVGTPRAYEALTARPRNGFDLDLLLADVGEEEGEDQ
jgi:hypothetical protein